MIVTVTGHRPQNLDGDFTLTSPLWRWIAARIDLHLIGATHLRCGMALGVDILAAERAHLLGVPYTAYVPFEGQPLMWSREDKLRYFRALTRASRCVMVNDGKHQAWKLHARNTAMLAGTASELAEPQSDALLAVWNGIEAGGTYQTTVVAQKLGIELLHVNPRDAPIS